jgi:dolichol-phosphate mannosyltransferase
LARAEALAGQRSLYESGPAEERIDRNSRPVISIIAPVFNEELVVQPFVEEVCRVMETSGLSFELVCVDDCSTDRSLSILQNLRERFPRLRVPSLRRHGGQTAALAAGVRLARGQFIALIDADMQNDPEDIPAMLDILRADPALVCVAGVRAIRKDTWLRRISSRIANAVAEMITGDAVTDAGCGLKLCRAEALKVVPFFRGAHRFLPTLIRMRGGAVVERRVNHRPRSAGQSKYGNGLSRTFVALADALGVRWLKSRAIRAEIDTAEG